MKRIKVPDYKDRNVFGVPLTVNVQRTGQALPQSIQQAMRYLRNHCLDQVSFPCSPLALELSTVPKFIFNVYWGSLLQPYPSEGLR